MTKLFQNFFLNLPPYRGDQQGHEGADDVEETVGEIDECGDTDFAKVRKTFKNGR